MNLGRRAGSPPSAELTGAVAGGRPATPPERAARSWSTRSALVPESSWSTGSSDPAAEPITTSRQRGTDPVRYGSLPTETAPIGGTLSLLSVGRPVLQTPPSDPAGSPSTSLPSRNSLAKTPIQHRSDSERRFARAPPARARLQGDVAVGSGHAAAPNRRSDQHRADDGRAGEVVSSTQWMFRHAVDTPPTPTNVVPCDRRDG